MRYFDYYLGLVMDSFYCLFFLFAFFWGREIVLFDVVNVSSQLIQVHSSANFKGNRLVLAKV